MLARSMLLLTALATSTARAETTFEHRALSVGLTVPDGWWHTRQTGYPALVVLLAPADETSRSTITLATAELRTPLGRFVADNRTALERARVRVTLLRSARVGQLDTWQLAARTVAGGTRAMEVRQYYLARNGRAFILTLSCPPAELQSRRLDFEQVIASLRL